MAKEFLEKNSDNRPICASKVSQYAHDISLDRFNHCYSPIIFGKNKKLIDGQHRLLAVVKANKSCCMYCIDTDFESFRQIPIDIGKSRSAKDYAIGGKRAASIAKVLMACHSHTKSGEVSPLALASVADSLSSNFPNFCSSSANAPLIIGAIAHFCNTGDEIGITYANAIYGERFEDLTKRVANWYRWTKNNPDTKGGANFSRMLVAMSFLQALSSKDGSIFKMYKIAEGEFQKNARERISDPIFKRMNTAPPQ